MRILLIEDEKITRITLSNTLRKEGFDVVNCEDGLTALKFIKEQTFHVVVTDLRLPGASGLEVLKTVMGSQPGCRVIIMTAYASVDTAVEALKNGAYDYLTKPFSPETLLVRLRNLQKLRDMEDENEKLKQRILSFEKRVIVGEAPATRKLIGMIQMVADRETTVLIQGESGTGKELVARALHHLSGRVNQPFIPVNCAAIPENLFESELFGHEKGSFTGAHRQHMGYFERAHGGTIFIDDIDDFPLALQVKLLRVLQEREFERVGGQRPVKVDVRILAASKVDLWQHVETRNFREDLFYRLNIVPIVVPPLRHRIEDLPLLVDHFMEKYHSKELARAKTASMMGVFMQYHWPGNVRQLENIIHRIAAVPELPPEDIFPGNKKPNPMVADPVTTSMTDAEYVSRLATSETGGPSSSSDSGFTSYKDYMLQKDREILDWALEKAQFNTSQAAKILDLPRSTLRSKMEKYDLKGDL